MASPTTAHEREAQAVAFSVPKLAWIDVIGSDAIKVVSGLCTALLKDIEVGSSKEAFFTDERGRVTVHAIIAREANGLSIVGQIADPAALAAHIDRFIFREDAAPRDVTANWYSWLLNDGELLARNPLPADLPFRTLLLPITGPKATLVAVQSDKSDRLHQWLESSGVRIASEAEFHELRIANFWPQIGDEILDRTLPQELDRDDRAISFTKGCYLGQETVARLDALGEVQKKLCLVELDGSNKTGADDEPELAPGAILLSGGKEVGRITSIAAGASDGKRKALANMRRGFFAPGTAFQAGSVNGVVLQHP